MHCGAAMVEEGLLDLGRRDDGHGRRRHILVHAAVARGDSADFVHHIHALDDLAEYGITVAVRLGAFSMSLFTTLMKNCEVAELGLPVRAMAIVPRSFFRPLLASSGMGARVVFLHVCIHAAALDHEAIDDAVEHRAVVVLVTHILQEIGRALGRLGFIELDHDVAHAGLELHLGLRLGKTGAAK